MDGDANPLNEPRNPPPPPPRNLRSPLDRDAPSRPSSSSAGPLLPTSRQRQPQASKWTLLWFPALMFASFFLFWTYLSVWGDAPWYPPYPSPSPSLFPASSPSSPQTPDNTTWIDERVHVPAVPEDTWRRCIDLLPTPVGTYAARLGRLASVLGEAVWVGEPGPSVEYLTGVFGEGSWSLSERPFLVAVIPLPKGEREVVILTPAFEEGRARRGHVYAEVKPTWLTWTESQSPYAVLMEYVGRREVVLDGPVRTFIGNGLRGVGAKIDDSAGMAARIAALRERKEEREIELMRCANIWTLHAIRRTRARMWMGISESRTRSILYEEMRYAGLQDYGALVLFGPNAALPHGSGTDRFLQPDEFVLIDAGGKWGGYVSDITRTFFLPDSDISDAHREVWEIVRAAQLAPANLFRYLERPDKPEYSWLDDRARETVKKGMAAYGVTPAKGHGPDYTVFTHRLGHGIGLEGHESPYAVQGAVGDREILPGHTLTFEPGVYIPEGREIGDESVRGLGVRLEDVVVIREEGEKGLKVEWLTGPVTKWGEV